MLYRRFVASLKMNLSLFFVAFFGGFPVIYSYYLLSLDPEASQLWAGLRGWVFWLWICSMCLTVLSYFYLFYMFVWGISDAYVFNWSSSEAEPWLCAVYSVFLGSAGQYVIVAMNDVRNKSKSFSLGLNVWSTGFASVLLGASAVAINGVSDVHNVLSIVAGFVVAIHHIVFDAVYWFQTFDPEYSELV